MKPRNQFLRTISLLLVHAFLFEQLAFANPDLKPAKLDLFQKPSVDLGIPGSVAVVEDSWFGSESPRTVYLLQDAHTNTSGQFNLAKTLDLLMQKEKKLKYVFVEAGKEDNSLSFLRRYGTPETRKNIAEPYLRSGELHGEEYLNLTSKRDFVLWGVEDLGLYKKSLEDYRYVASQREKFLSYLSRVQTTISTLKTRVYNGELLSFDALYEKYRKEEIPLTDYFEALRVQARLLNVGLEDFSELETLSRLKQIESSIDFKVASTEEAQAVAALSQQDQAELTEASKEISSPFKLGAGDNKAGTGFFKLLEEKLSTHELPLTHELSKYFAYLKLAKKMNPTKILSEVKILEGQVFQSLARMPDEKALLRSQATLHLLDKLFNLTLTPEEYQDYKTLAAGYGITALTGFLNEKIMDLKSLYERAIFLEPGYEEMVRTAENFYELTYERDQHFVNEMLRKMDSSPAILITGGFHTPNLKSLLKQKNISFISVTPQVLQETNQKRYEKILLGQAELFGFSNTPTISSGAHTNRTMMIVSESRLAAESGMAASRFSLPLKKIGDALREGSRTASQKTCASRVLTGGEKKPGFFDWLLRFFPFLRKSPKLTGVPRFAAPKQTPPSKRPETGSNLALVTSAQSKDSLIVLQLVRIIPSLIFTGFMLYLQQKHIWPDPKGVLARFEPVPQLVIVTVFALFWWNPIAFIGHVLHAIFYPVSYVLDHLTKNSSPPGGDKLTNKHEPPTDKAGARFSQSPLDQAQARELAASAMTNDPENFAITLREISLETLADALDMVRAVSPNAEENVNLLRQKILLQRASASRGATSIVQDWHRRFDVYQKKASSKPDDFVKVDLFIKETSGDVSIETVYFPAKEWKNDRSELVFYLASLVNARGIILGANEVGFTLDTVSRRDARAVLKEIETAVKTEFGKTDSFATYGKGIQFVKGSLRSIQKSRREKKTSIFLNPRLGIAGGFDLGGTRIKWILVKDGVTLTKGAEFVSNIPNIGTFIKEKIEAFERDHQVSLRGKPIYVAVPGPVDSEGNIMGLVNLPSSVHAQLTALRKENPDIFFSNDAKSGAYFHKVRKRLKGNVLVSALGTGHGFAVFINGKLVEGPQEAHSMIVFDKDARTSGFGMKGDVEAYTNIKFVMSRAKELAGEWGVLLDGTETPETIAQWLDLPKGDKKFKIADQIYHELGYWLGIFYHDVARKFNIYDWDVILTGGLVKDQIKRRTRIQAGIHTALYELQNRDPKEVKLKVAFSEEPEFSNALGAAYLSLEMQQRSKKTKPVASRLAHTVTGQSVRLNDRNFLRNGPGTISKKLRKIAESLVAQGQAIPAFHERLETILKDYTLSQAILAIPLGSGVEPLLITVELSGLASPNTLHPSIFIINLVNGKKERIHVLPERDFKFEVYGPLLLISYSSSIRIYDLTSGKLESIRTERFKPYMEGNFPGHALGEDYIASVNKVHLDTATGELKLRLADHIANTRRERWNGGIHAKIDLASYINNFFATKPTAARFSATAQAQEAAIREELGFFERAAAQTGVVSSLPSNLSLLADSKLSNFFLGVAFAQPDVKTSRLALNRAVFTYQKQGNVLHVSSVAGTNFTLNLLEERNTFTASKSEGVALTIQGINALNDALTQQATQVLGSTFSSNTTTVVVTLNLNDLIPTQGSRLALQGYWEALLAATKHIKAIYKNTVFVLEGDSISIHEALSYPGTPQGLFYTEGTLPSNLKEFPQVRISSNLQKDIRNLLILSVKKGSVPAYKAILSLAVALGLIDPLNPPDGFKGLWSTLSGVPIDSATLTRIIQGLMDPLKASIFAIKPIAMTSWHEAIQALRSLSTAA